MNPHRMMSVRTRSFSAALLTVVLLVIPHAAKAQTETALSVSVTPPLFQLTIGPGEFWASSIKIVNSNPFDVTYYTTLADFEARGEGGQSKFIPLLDEVNDPTRQTFSLASWLTLSPEPVVVKAGQSGSVPFSIRIPENAEPGGHYAAILVGTEPPPDAEKGAQVKVSSFVSSLLFVKVKGETNESGRIREFRTEQQLYDSPKADFMLRFENTGNTHLKPKGNIVIYNMWGKSRGMVEINQNNNFGNVLPKSIRKFEFSWDGEANPFEIGRYSAVVTLSYGEENKQNISATNYFWVIPVVPVSIALGLAVLFVVLILLFVRRYIRRALAIEQAMSLQRGPVRESRPSPRVIETLMEPIREGIIDLRKVGIREEQRHPRPVSVALLKSAKTDVRVPRYVEETPEETETMTLLEFIVEYKAFVGFVILLMVSSLVVWGYFHRVLTPNRTYQITGVETHDEDPAQNSR